MKKFRLAIFILPLLLIISCNSGNKTDCKFSPPEALFTEEHPGVITQEFILEGMNSSETVEFPQKIKLELLQQGCESVEQEFRFTLPYSPEDEGDLAIANTTVDLFKLMSQSSEKLGERGILLIQTLEAIKQDIRIGQRLAIAPGFFIKIDRIRSGQDQIISVNFNEGV